MIERLETLHSLNLLHRDIKPENFVMGIHKKANLVYLIDFGLAKRYKDPKTGQHYTMKNRESIVGTERYVSRYA